MTDEHEPHVEPYRRRRLVEPLAELKHGALASPLHRELVARGEDPPPIRFTNDETLARPHAPAFTGEATDGAVLLDFALDWPELYADDRDCFDDEWLVRPFLAARRAHVVYSPAKVGKSLLTLGTAAGVATGRPILGRPASEPVPVIYCDYEMTPDDVLERLEAFGYHDPAELACLHYVLLPAVPSLDTDAGGAVLETAIERTDAQLVVIDTTARAVEGPENESDTYRNFERHTGRRLRRLGITWARLDHAGKNIARGQRGSSAKNDDPDIVWQLTGDAVRLDLRATHRRMPWVPERFQVLKQSVGADLRLELVDAGWPLGTNDVADALDRLRLPLDASNRAARTALRDAGEGARNDVIAAALRWRRERSRNAPGTAALESPESRVTGSSRAFPDPAPVPGERVCRDGGNADRCPTCGAQMKRDGYCPECDA